MALRLNKAILVVITGPTAVGKTELCVKIAQHYQTEIISADSRQLYQELNIGTAKPSIDEMKNVKHHFIDSHPVSENYNANNFEKDALKLLQSLFKKHPLVILTGGSGLYIDALCNGFDDDLPEGDEKIRKELDGLYQKYGISILHDKLKQLDPQFYKEIDLSNVKRLLRALEVCMITGTPYSKLRKGKKQDRFFDVIKIGLNRDKKELFDRINKRVENMMQQGLLEEVKNVRQFRNNNALKTVGYSELFNYLDNKITLEEAVEKIKTNTRRYAKRQIAWFNRNNDYSWFHPKDFQQIIHFIENSTTPPSQII